MNSITNKLSTAGFAALLLAVSPLTYGEEAPLPAVLSDEAVSVSPSVSEEVSEGSVAECGTGLKRAVFSVFDNETEIVCEPLFFPPTDLGISCTTNGDSVEWSLESGREEPPFAIDSVILEDFFPFEDCGECFEDRSIFYTYQYESPYGASTDANIAFYAPEDLSWSDYLPATPRYVAFCYSDQPNAATPGVAEIPVCPADTAGCSTAILGDDTSVLVEVIPLRDSDGDIVQPAAAPNEDTCVCSSSITPEPLAQCDPGAGEGEPNACRDPSQGGPGQVTRLFQQNGDPYFCTTQNGRRRCWSY